MNVDALSHEEWNYIRGLFLADGSASIVYDKRGWRRYRVGFCLQGNEQGIVDILVAMMRRAGMNPWVMYPRRKDEIVVEIVSKALFEFLPRKSDLRLSAEIRARFFDEKGLYKVANGVPFLAGLLDGDGTLNVYVQRGRSSGVSCLGDVAQWTWSLTQRSYLFLVDYVRRLVESLAPHVTRIHQCKGGTVLIPYVRVARRLYSGLGSRITPGRFAGGLRWWRRFAAGGLSSTLRDGLRKCLV